MMSMFILSIISQFIFGHTLDLSAAHVAFNGIETYLQSENVPCFTVSSSNKTFLKWFSPILSSGDYGGRIITKPINEVNGLCETVCCDYTIIFLTNMEEMQSKVLSHFRVYIFVNLETEQNTKTVQIKHDNFLIFQAIKNSKRFFSVHGKKKGRIEQLQTWNGESFLDNNPIRSVRGETLRIGAAITPPWALLFTPHNYGKPVIKGGAIVTMIRAIAKVENLNLRWIDVIREENLIWGTLYENGTSTGMVKLILHYKADICTPILCGMRMHKNLVCSTMLEFDGLLPMLQRPKPKASWLGLVTLYTPIAWVAIVGALFAGTIVIGICTRLSNRSAKYNWSLHFLDALNPMTGRPMSMPGFHAAHLGGQNKILAFQLFLATYSLACVVINIGYEGNLKSHLSAVVYPRPINTLEEFADAPFNNLIFVNRELNDLIRIMSSSSVDKIASLANDSTRLLARRTNYSHFFWEAVNNHALIGAKHLFAYQIKRQLTKRDGKTDMQVVPQFLAGYPSVLHLGRMNRFTKVINRRAEQWIEGGLMQEHLKREINNAKSKPLEETDLGYRKNNFDRLDLSVFRVLFAFFAWGITVANLAFIMEVFFERNLRKKNNHKHKVYSNLSRNVHIRSNK